MFSPPWGGIAAATGGILAAAGAATLGFSYWQALKLLYPRRTFPAQSPEELGLAMERVTIPGPRGNLVGWYLPARNGCTLVCCHGIGDNRSQWLRQVAALYARSGYGALLFDFAGHGESAEAPVTYGVREQLDVRAALEYLRARGDVAMDRIGYLGYSLGAITGILAAPELPEVRAFIFESGFADLLRDVQTLFTRFTGLPAFPFANLVIAWGQRLSGVRLADIRPMRVIGGISPRAVFLISDLKDGLANEPYDGEHLFAEAGEPKQFWQVPDAGHIAAFALYPEEWVRRVGDFLDTYLAGAFDAPIVGTGAVKGHLEPDEIAEVQE